MLSSGTSFASTTLVATPFSQTSLVQSPAATCGGGQVSQLVAPMAEYLFEAHALQLVAAVEAEKLPAAHSAQPL